MPIRTTPLVNNEVYHVYNRGISFTPTFISKINYQRAMEILDYYQFSNTPVSFSKLKRFSLKKRASILEKLYKENDPLVKIICFCLMPNHFHLLLKQLKKDGISTFIANFQNSYTRFFNLKSKRIGPLFQGPFKTVRIETEEQLLHVSRYIHLNPYSSLVIKNLEELEEYPWSSLREYLYSQKENLSSSEEILSSFKNLREYKEFVFDQAHNQRELDKIKHLIME